MSSTIPKSTIEINSKLTNSLLKISQTVKRNPLPCLMDSLQLSIPIICTLQYQVQLVIMIDMLPIGDSQIIITTTMQIGGDQVGDELREEWTLCEVPQTEEHTVELHQVEVPQIEERMVELYQVEVSQPGESIQEEHLGMVTHPEDKYPKWSQVGIHNCQI